jgi:hypothetical protein
VLRPRDRNRHVSPHHHGSKPNHTPSSRPYSRLSQSKWRLVLQRYILLIAYKLKPSGSQGLSGQPDKPTSSLIKHRDTSAR